MGNCPTKECPPCEKPKIKSEEPQGIVSMKIPAPVTSSPTELTDFEKNILIAHNKARTGNGLEPLVWDKKLQMKAQDWVDFMVKEDQNGMCVNKETGANRHPGEGVNAKWDERDRFLPNNWGQNIYQSNSIRIEPDGTTTPVDSASPLDAVRKWYSECSDYTNKMDNQGIPIGWNNKEKPIGHFTQLMWSDAKKVGCAKIPCKGEFTVAGTPAEGKGHVYVCNYDKGNVAGQFSQKVKWPVKCTPPNNWIAP